MLAKKSPYNILCKVPAKRNQLHLGYVCGSSKEAKLARIVAGTTKTGAMVAMLPHVPLPHLDHPERLCGCVDVDMVCLAGAAYYIISWP